MACGIFLGQVEAHSLVGMEPKLSFLTIRQEVMFDDYQALQIISHVHYKEIPQENLPPSSRQLWLWKTFIFQQENDPKHPDNVTRTWFEESKVDVLESHSKSPDLNSIENSRLDLKRAVHTLSPPTCKSPWLSCKTNKGVKHPRGENH